VGNTVGAFVWILTAVLGGTLAGEMLANVYTSADCMNVFTNDSAESSLFGSSA
jgi:hypothetical protein